MALLSNSERKISFFPCYWKELIRKIYMDICSQTAELVLLIGEEFTTVKLITSSFYTKSLLNRIKLRSNPLVAEVRIPWYNTNAFCIGTDTRVLLSSNGLKILLIYMEKKNLIKQNKVQIKSTTNIRCSGMVV